MNPLKPWSRKRLARVAIRASLGSIGLFAGYLLLLCHPGSFFGHSYTHGGITLHSDEPIPEAARLVLEDAEDRLAQSPLTQDLSNKNIHIYICNRSWRFMLFANFHYHVGGLTYPPLSRNIFLRESRLDDNRLVGPSGREVPGERTLSYFVAHEIMHVLIADRIGPVAYWRLPDWKNEGYSDYIARGTDFEYQRAVVQFRRRDREMDPQRSGLYLRYSLLVAYLLDHNGIPLDVMLGREFKPADLEREILGGDAR